MIENTSKLQAKVKALTNVDGKGGVDILTDTGAYKSTYQILLEIAEVWDKLNEYDPKAQAALLEILAGKTRGSQVASILQNPEDLRDAYKMALNSDGSAQKELETYLNSIQGRIDLFTNQLQTFWMNLINSNIIKLVVDAGTTIIEVLNGIMNAIDKVAEGLGSLGVIIPTVLGAFKFGKFKKDNGIKDIFDLFTIGSDKIKNGVEKIKGLDAVKDTITAYGKAMSDMGPKVKGIDLLAELGNFGASSEQLGALAKLIEYKDENTEVSTKFVEAMLKEHATELGLNDATVQAILNSQTFTVAQAANTTSTLTFGGALDVLKVKLLATWKAFLAFLATPVGMIVGATAAVAALVGVINLATTSHKEYKEQLEESTKELEDIRSKLKSLNEEFEDTNEQIKELQSKGTLTFTEESELARLKSINSELDRAIKLEEAKEKRAKQEQINNALGTAKTDKNLQDQFVSIGTEASYAASYGAGEQKNIGNQWQQNLNALESAYRDLDSAQQALVEAEKNKIDENSQEYKTLQKNVEKAENRISSLNTTIDGFDTSWQETYGNIGYIENATTAQEKAWNEFYRQHQEYITQQAFLNKDIGKADVLSSTFGTYASDSAKKFKEEFEKAINEGKDPTQVLKGLFSNREYSELFNGLISDYNIDSSDIIGFFTNTGEYAEKASEKIATTVTSLDKLTAAVDGYKNALDIVNTITADGQAISEDYYNTLKEQLADVTVGEEDFSDAIDTSNGYVVKNASLLHKLVNQSKKAQKSTIQMAKAQAQLQYKELVKKMSSTIGYMGVYAKGNSIISQSIKENVNMMQDQLDSLKQTIQQYALLELSLSNAANAFNEYEKAKERDAQLTYDDSMLEMLKTIDEGLLKNETGTEAFEYAVKALVPEQFWKDIDDVDAKIRSIHDYLDGNEVFSQFFHVDAESGELDITTDNVRAFVKMCVDSGLFDGNSKDFVLSDSVEGIEDFANQLGVTEAVALAMLTSLEKVDAKWENILTDVTMSPFDRKVNSAVQEVATLNTQLADGSITAKEYAEKMAVANQKLVEYTQEAKNKLFGSDNGTEDTSDDTLGFIETNKKVAAAQLEVEKATDALTVAQERYNKAKDDPTITSEELGEYEHAVSEATKTLETHTDAWSKLVKERGKYPTEYEIELVISDIDKEIASIGDKFDDVLGAYFIEDSDGMWVVNTKVHPDVNMDDLEAKYSGIKNYIALLNSKTEIKTFADTTSAEEDANQLKATVDGVIQAIEQNLITLDLDEAAVQNIVTQANKILEGIGSGLSVSLDYTTPWGSNISLGQVGFDVNAGESGAANALGNNGLKSSERNAVVGELGQEMVVDPVKGVYYTVGDNGTEMVDLPKGAIIYNHKQTEELLKKGYTSRGKLTGGLSFANGNAHNYGIPSYHPNTEDATSLNNGSKINDTWDDAASKLEESADGLSNAANDLSDAAESFEGAINWIDVLFARIENNIAEQEARLETLVDTSGSKYLKDSLYESIFGQLYDKASQSLSSRDYYRQKANEAMSGLPSDIQKKIKDGTIDIQEFKFNKSTEGKTETQKKAIEKEREAYEKYVEQINKAIEYYDKTSEYEQQYWTTITEIADKAVERQEDVAQGYENEIGLTEHLNNTLEAHNDLLESKTGFASESYYNAQIDANETILDQLQSQRKAMQSVLDEEVKLGRVKIGTQQWFDMQQAIYDVDDAIIDTQSSIEDLKNSINDLKWSKFDELINRFEYVEEEISNVIQLLSHDVNGLVSKELSDLTSDNWATDSGLTTIGLYAQEMERAQYVANQYAEAIKDLEKDYAAGKYNETEYLSKLNELTSAQYENIEKYYDARDAIIELNEARVDAIRDGIQKEIDKYSELIDKKKELLSREQDLHDFNNEIEEKEKDVSRLRKQLAAMDGDTTAATTAKRKQLQAELIEAEKSLEDSYYSHSMTARQEALDQEFSSFEEEKNKEIEKWEEWLLNTEIVVGQALTYVKDNTSIVYTELSELGGKYGLTLSDTLTTPWQNGKFAIDDYSVNFETAISAFTLQLDSLVEHWNSVSAAAEQAARDQAAALQAEYNKTTTTISSANKTVSSGTENKSNTSSAPTSTTKAVTTGSKVKVNSNEHIYSSPGVDAGKQYFRDDPQYIILGEKDGYYKVRWYKLSSGVTGWFKKSQVKAYAKGTNKIDEDQWALLNELGPELQLMAGASGNLEYVKYGTSIIPSDVSEKLINLAVDPASVFDGLKTDVKAPSVETKDFNFDFSFDSLLHVDNASNDSIPALQKMIRSEFNTMLKSINNGIKRA